MDRPPPSFLIISPRAMRLDPRARRPAWFLSAPPVTRPLRPSLARSTIHIPCRVPLGDETYPTRSSVCPFRVLLSSTPGPSPSVDPDPVLRAASTDRARVDARSRELDVIFRGTLVTLHERAHWCLGRGSLLADRLVDLRAEREGHVRVVATALLVLRKDHDVVHCTPQAEGACQQRKWSRRNAAWHDR